MTETLTVLDGDGDCPVCGGSGTIPVLVYGFFTSTTEHRPCSAPIHRKKEE